MTTAPTNSPCASGSVAAPRKKLREFLDLYAARAREGVFEGPRYRVAYAELGDGPPIYVIQGICSTRRCFAPLAVELSLRFKVVLYDLVGVNPGDGGRLRQYGLEDYTRDLFALADHLGDRTFPILANSFGTTIGVRAMSAEPTRIPKGIMAGGFAYRPLAFAEHWSAVALQWCPGRLRSVPFSNAVSRYNHGRELERREPGLTDFLLEESGATPIRTVAAQGLAIDSTDNRQLATQVRQPVLIIHGEQDRLVPARHASELAKRMANVQIMLIPGCGHIPHLSHPEVMAQVAFRFLGMC